MTLSSVILLFAVLLHMCSSAHLNVAIVNGTEAKPHSRPYMVSLQNSQGEHVCGGFLVNDSFVMSAAHCWKSGKELTAVVGAHDLHSKHLVRIPVKKINIHPEYKHKCLLNDIMLLELKHSTKKFQNIASIQIPKDTHFKKENCSVAGWGKKTSKGPSSNRLMEAVVRVFSKKTCQTQWGKCYSDVGVMCAGGLLHGFCEGDSGGPLVCDEIAVGVASFYQEGECEKSTKPNVYAKIADFLSWIRNTTRFVK